MSRLRQLKEGQDGRGKRLPVQDRVGKGARARDLLEVPVLDLEDRDAALEALLANFLGHLVAQPPQVVAHPFQIRGVAGEGVFAAQGMPGTEGKHGPLVDAARQTPEMPRRARPEVAGKQGFVPLQEVSAGADPHALEALLGGLPYPVEGADGKSLQEGRSALGADHREAVGLVAVRGALGEELVEGHPGRSRETRFLADAGADLLGDRRHAGEIAAVVHQLQVGLVQGERLDQFGVVVEDRAQLLRDLHIGGKARRDEDRLRTQSARLGTGHGASDAELAGRVACRADHRPAVGRSAHHQRQAPKRGVVPLLDRRVEGVHVHMHDASHRINLGTAQEFISNNTRDSVANCGFKSGIVKKS